MYKPPYVRTTLFLSKQAKIFWEKSFKEGGLGKQHMQASNGFGKFGKEGGLQFSVYKGKISSCFQR